MEAVGEEGFHAGGGEGRRHEAEEYHQELIQPANITDKSQKRISLAFSRLNILVEHEMDAHEFIEVGVVGPGGELVWFHFYFHEVLFVVLA